MAKKTTLLICVNNKEHSHVALKFACMMAKSRKASVTMLGVIDPMDYNTIFSVADVIKEDRIQEAETLMKTWAKEMKAWAGVTPKIVIEEGGIVDTIMAQIAADDSISMLILGAADDGSAGRSAGPLAELTSEIGDRYHIPLMVIPGNLTDQQIQALN